MVLKALVGEWVKRISVYRVRHAAESFKRPNRASERPGEFYREGDLPAFRS
jgi:hypothetical protein